MSIMINVKISLYVIQTTPLYRVVTNRIKLVGSYLLSPCGDIIVPDFDCFFNMNQEASQFIYVRLEE